MSRPRAPDGYDTSLKAPRLSSKNPFGLILLGIGWNFGLVSGSTLIADSVPLEFRARAQGTIDLGVAVAAAAAGLGSGLIVSATSYTALALTGGLVALMVIPVAGLARIRHKTSEFSRI